MVAAHGGADWVVRGHGLRELATEEPITRSRFQPTPTGLFARICEILGTGPLTAPVELGAVWSAIPDLAFTALPGDEWPCALRVFPEDVDHKFARFHGGGTIVVPFAHKADELETYLHRNYPAAAQARLSYIPGVGVQTNHTPYGTGYVARWGEEVEGADGSVQWAEGILNDEVPPYRFHDEHWLVPRVGAGRDDLSPLALWWVLLFGFSIIARYEPAKWKRALDPDSSGIAVLIEDALSEALTAVPHLLLIALSDEAAIFSRDTPGL